MKAPNINHFTARMIVDYLVRWGVRHFSISPGSRSAPLAIAAASHSGIAARMVIDERASAYYATGVARATGSPAGVICTSGTAVANLFPAVVEAYQSLLPLILLTADRPDELQDCGANQTIDQQGIFGRYAASVTIPASERSADPTRILDSLERMMADVSEGPIHINVRFREPLAPVEEPYDHDTLSARIEEWYQSRRAGSTSPKHDDLARPIEDIIPLITHSRRGLIVAGPELPPYASMNIGRLAERLGWPMVCDILSQQRGGKHGNRCYAYDHYLDSTATADNLACDLVVHVGGVPTSKRLNQFLARHKGIPYIKIQSHDRIIDPDRLETRRITAPVAPFVDALAARVETGGDDSYQSSWLSAENRTAKVLATCFADDRLTEPSTAFHLGRLIGDGEALFLSNSMTVRDADSFMDFEDRDVMIGCNRGVSGIDGVAASACGMAAGSGRPTTLLIGDLALLHDLNSLALAAESTVPVIIIVINNHGGGIFDFLPVARFPDLLEQCIAAPHRCMFDSAAGMFGLSYYRPATVAELVTAYRAAHGARESAIVEIITDRAANVGEHERIHTMVHEELKRIKE